MNARELADEISYGRISRGKARKSYGLEMVAAAGALIAAERAAYIPPVGVEAASEMLIVISAEDARQDAVRRDEQEQKAAAAAAIAGEFSRLRELVVRTAARSGWATEDICQAQTGSCYYTLARGDRLLVVRVADHETAYCREDISLVVGGGGGDDHAESSLVVSLA